MNVALVTPAHLGKRTGNSITADRWLGILRELGHNVIIKHEYIDENIDVLIALNAYRSKESILKYRIKYPKQPLIVALTGTDLYRFIESDTAETMKSITSADRLVVLNNLSHKVLPKNQWHKTYLIYESAKPLPKDRQPLKRYFDICVIGHLRPEKNPMITAKAVRNLPLSSKIRVRHYGKAHTEDWAEKARGEMVINNRYKWFGEVPHWQIRQALSKCSLIVISSKMEGGPNVLSEAVVAGVPVLATDIDGCVGVLGNDYPGYFSVGDTDAIKELLYRVETDTNFLLTLENFVTRLGTRFSYEKEKSRWENLLNELVDEQVKQAI